MRAQAKNLGFIIMIKHIVLLNFRSDIPRAKIIEALEMLGELQNSDIQQIISYSYGVNNSPENLSSGFNYGFIMTFDNVYDRDYYLEHPKHKEIAQKYILPLLTDGINSVLVFDY